MYSPGRNAQVMMRCLMASYAVSRSEAAAPDRLRGSDAARRPLALDLINRLDGSSAGIPVAHDGRVATATPRTQCLSPSGGEEKRARAACHRKLLGIS